MIKLQENYKKVKQQVSITAIYKSISLILNYILIALLINYLGEEKFGIYIALTSLFSWMFLFDLGIAKGMRNYVTTSFSKQNIQEAKEYITTAYVSILFITIIACTIIISVLSFVDLQQFFNIKLENSYLQSIFFILIIGFFLKFYLSTVDQLNYAIHQSQNVSLNILLVSIFNTIGIFFLWKFEYKNDIIYAITVYSLAIILPYLYSTIYFFYYNKQLIPAFSTYSQKALKNILNNGSKILLIQIGFLLIVGIDRLILLKYGSATDVAKYEILYKVMSIVVFPVSIIMAPLWSSFTEAYEKNDLEWIKKIFKKFYLLTVILLIITLILILSFNVITSIWLTNFPYINFYLRVIMGILIIEIIWSTFHTDFLLGIQDLSYIIRMISIGLLLKFGFLFLSLTNNHILSISDIVISSILGYLIYNINVPFRIKNLIKKKALHA